MIESIEAQRLSTRCAACKVIRDVAIDTLRVKVMDTRTTVVSLPACPCGAVEFLVRAERPEHPLPGSESHRHQLLVDHLHAELASRKRLAPGSAAAEQLCSPVPADTIRRWFSAGLHLHMPATETES